jgi:hypothetical protein
MTSKIIMIILLGVIISACTYKEQRIQKIQSQYPEWEQATVEKLAAGEVETGMSRVVVAALGKPDAISHEGDVEVWGFIAFIPGYRGESVWIKKLVYFVYLKNDRVLRTAGDRDKLDHLYWYK